MAENPLATRTSPEKPHSIEVSRNAKGEYSFSVKMYFEDHRATDALDYLEKIYQQLLHTYKTEK